MLQPETASSPAGAAAPRPNLRLFRPESPYVALGLAVSHLMTKPAFANLRFGDWSRVLVVRSIVSTTPSWSTRGIKFKDFSAGR
jgi:hypothetical protein